MERDDLIVKLRPQLSISLNNSKNDHELFMHTTLRPILKFQNDLILTLIHSEKHLQLETLKIDDHLARQNYLSSFLQKNTVLRNNLIGSIIGLFTLNEITFYKSNKTALNKRIIDMIVTRYLSQR